MVRGLYTHEPLTRGDVRTQSKDRPQRRRGTEARTVFDGPAGAAGRLARPDRATTRAREGHAAGSRRRPIPVARVALRRPSNHSSRFSPGVLRDLCVPTLSVSVSPWLFLLGVLCVLCVSAACRRAAPPLQPPLVPQVSGTLAVAGLDGARARRPRHVGRAAHLRAEPGRSVLRAGLRAGAGPAVSDGPVAAIGAGTAVRGAGAELHRARRDDAAHAVSRRSGRGVGELRTRRARRSPTAFVRGVNAWVGARARAAAGGVRARGLEAGAVVGRRSAEPHRGVHRERRRARRSLSRAADRGGRRWRARGCCCRTSARSRSRAASTSRPSRSSSPTRSAASGRRRSFWAWRRRSSTERSGFHAVRRRRRCRPAGSAGPRSRRARCDHPSLRYFVHLNAPGWNVIGATAPWRPGVADGHNDRIALDAPSRSTPTRRTSTSRG